MSGNNTALAKIAEVTEYSRAQVELVKDTIARGASDDELMMFMMLAKRTGLDPFAKQIYLIERSSNVDGKWVTSRQPQTGIDGLRLIADRTGNYAPGREPSFQYSDDGRLFSATSYVCKYVRGEWREVAATAHYDEYVQLKKDGKPNKMWSDKPHVMLAKCAEALALRRAFPAEMSGVYTSDEIRDVEPVIVMDSPAPVQAARSLPPPAPQPAPAAEPESFSVDGIASNVTRKANGKGESYTSLTINGVQLVAKSSDFEGLEDLEDGDPATAVYVAVKNSRTGLVTYKVISIAWEKPHPDDYQADGGAVFTPLADDVNDLVPDEEPA